MPALIDHTPPPPDSNRSIRPAVLHVTFCFAGGVSRAVRAIASATPQYDHRVLAAGADLEAVRGFEHVAAVQRLEGGILRRFRTITAASRDPGVQVVHAHSSWAGVFVRLTAPRGTRLVYQPHGYAFERPRSVAAAIAFAVEALLSRRPQRVAVLSPREEQLARRLNPRASTVLVPNAPTLCEQMVRDPGTTASKRRIAMIGRVCPQKDPDLFTEVVALVRARVPDVEVVWIGAGARRDEDRLRRAGVEVTGWVVGDDLARCIDSVDVVVHTARYEGFPISILDAAARHVPVVARDIPALAGTSIVRAAGAPGIADAAIACLQDPDFARAVANRGLALLRSMNTETQRVAFEGLYRGGESRAEVALR